MRRRRKVDKKKLCDMGKLLMEALAAAILVTGVFQLRSEWILLLSLLFLPGLGSIWKQQKKRNYQDKRFEQCMDYLQQLIFAFEKTGELTVSLRETRAFYGEDEMGRSLDEALDYLESTYSGNSKEVALKIIEEKFPCKIVKTVHNFLIEAETTGGRTEAALDILKTELQRYRTRVKLFQGKCRKNRTNIIVAVGAGILLCASLLYLTPNAGALANSLIYQAGTVVMCVLSMGILYGGFSLTCRDWLEETKSYSEEELEQKLLKYLNNKQKIRKKDTEKHFAKGDQPKLSKLDIEIDIASAKP